MLGFAVDGIVSSSQYSLRTVDVVLDQNVCSDE